MAESGLTFSLPGFSYVPKLKNGRVLGGHFFYLVNYVEVDLTNYY